jgi:hypothetical protein
MRIWEEAIARSLRGAWFNAGTAEIDEFINNVRGFINGKVRIEQGEQKITIEFPQPVAMAQTKVRRTAKELEAMAIIDEANGPVKGDA